MIERQFLAAADPLVAVPGMDLRRAVEKMGPGWVLGPDASREPCFAHLSLKAAVEVEGKSLNALSGAMADFFTTSTKDER